MPKRKYEKKLENSILRNKEFLVEQLKQEWEEAEKAFNKEKKKKQLLRLAKSSGEALGKGLLALLLMGGILTVIAVAPNIFSAFGRSIRHKRFFQKNQFNKDKYYLKRQGWIKIEKENEDNFRVVLTEKGEAKALEDIFNNLEIKKAEKTDDFWRAVFFDIPNKNKWAREGFREKLKDLGFYQLQESVFITPYSCEKEIAFLTSVFNIVSYVYLIKTKDFCNNKDLKEVFDI